MRSTVVGEYELVALLGTGGMAEVYAARSLVAGGGLVVVKQMLPQFAAEPAFIEMFLDEGRTISLLRHPNVVRMHGFGYHGDRPYLAMEYLQGLDLRSVMRALRAARAYAPLPVVLAIIAGVCAGLHHAHEATTLDGRPLELVHRDVSPQNVVLTFDGVPKLIDFGIAKSRERDHQTRGGTLKGKVPYMSPEQVRGLALDRRTDVYAAGVILYELLTGRRPYQVERGDAPRGEFSLMMAIVSGRIARLSQVRPGLPAAIERLVERALAPQVEHRYPTAAAFGEAIATVARELGMPLVQADVAALVAGLAPARASAPALDVELERDDAPDDEAPATSIEGTELAVEAAPEVARLPHYAVVALDARLDERFDGAQLARQLTGPTLLDLGAVERITSFGLREWLALQRGLERRPDVTLYLVRCPEPFITQLGHIRGFAGAAHVVSVLAPFSCGACANAWRVELDLEHDAADIVGAAPARVCPHCGATGQLDDDHGYFAPVRGGAGRALPAAVRDAVARIAPRAASEQQLDKQVEGAVTRVRALRPLGTGVRWSRWLAGVEGTLALELDEARLDVEGGRALAEALAVLGPEVARIVLGGVSPAVADTLVRVPRVVLARLVVTGRCPSCAVLRRAPVEMDELTATPRCHRCDDLLVDLDSAPIAAPAPPRGRARLAIAAFVSTLLGVASYLALREGMP